MTVFTSLILFLGCGLFLLWHLRRDRLSLGLPLAYFIAMALEHVPGAYVYLATGGASSSIAVERGIALSTTGIACFTAGVVGSNLIASMASKRGRNGMPLTASSGKTGSQPLALAREPIPLPRENGPKLWLFCLVGGWALIYGVSLVLRLPTLGAIIEKGGAIWMLGVMLGLAHALRRRDLLQALIWLSALAVYPALMLIIGGFMSYGSAAVIICCSILLIAARSYWKVIVVTGLCFILAINIFVNYFAARNVLRNAVWGGASIERRIDVVFDAVAQAHVFSIKNYADINALNLRLNQNYFIGLSADRLDGGYVEYLRGQSVVDGMIALVPRALWPEKPVYGGSPGIVRRMTGLDLNLDTSWGVGQVMEFYINFAMPGLVGGFLILGLLFGWLDRGAALALRTAADGRVFLYFLPCIALIQPIGSMVELFGGAGAALGAAFAWRFVWNSMRRRDADNAQFARLIAGNR